MTKERELLRLRDYKRDQVTAIRCLRRKLQRALKQPLTNEEVALYWSRSQYGHYFKSHTIEANRVA